MIPHVQPSPSGAAPRARRSPVAVVLLAVSLLGAACSSSADDADALGSTSTLGPDAAAVTTAPSLPELPVTPTPAEIERQIERWLAQGHGEGGVVVAQRTGREMVYAAAGTADADGTPMTIDRRFRIAGLTKLFVAVLVLLEAEAGTIDLDAPLATYLPELAGETGITTRQLLGDRTGLPDFTTVAFFNEALFAARDRVWTAEEVLSLVAPLPPSFAPGTEFEYSNSNYVTLGLLLETVTGKSLAELTEAQIAAPLGLVDTTIGDGDDVVDGYSAATGGWLGRPYTSIASSVGGAGAALSTAPEVAVFIEALLDGELLEDASLAMMTDAADDGRGMANYPVPFVAGPGVAQSGAIPGFSAVAGGRSTSDETIVVLANRDDIDPQLLVIDLLTAE